MLLSLFPLFGLKISGLLIGVWAVFSIIMLFKEKTYKLATRKDYMAIGVFSALYIAYIVNYILTIDDVIVKKLETCLSLLIFPLFVILNKSLIEKKTLDKSLIGFFIANTLLAFYTWLKIFKYGFSKMVTENNYYQPVFRNMFSETTSIHLPYLGLFFAFSIFIGIYLITEKELKKPLEISICFVCIILFISILFFSARMALLSLIVSFVYWFYKKIKNKLLFTSISVGFITIMVAVILFTPFKDRIQEFVTAKFELPSEAMNEESKNVNFRYAIYHCASKIVEDNWLFGVGKNNLQRKLNDCYSDFSYENYDDFSKKTYNSHNQYLDILMSFGTLGLIIIAPTFFYGYNNSNQTIYNILLLFIFLGLTTENLFDRQLGVVFFAFFNSLFFISKK